jgi:hypothetical protein
MRMLALELPHHQRGCDSYNYTDHGKIQGQEPTGGHTKVWLSCKPHIGGRNQVCCQMDVPSADEAAHQARYLRVILLSPLRPEGTPLLPRNDRSW